MWFKRQGKIYIIINRFERDLIGQFKLVLVKQYGPLCSEFSLCALTSLNFPVKFIAKYVDAESVKPMRSFASAKSRFNYNFIHPTKQNYVNRIFFLSARYTLPVKNKNEFQTHWTKQDNIYSSELRYCFSLFFVRMDTYTTVAWIQL